MLEAIVVCGPSGVGKGTLIGKLLADYPAAFGFSVSVTTRGPRPGEVDGTHYHFLTRAQAQAQIDAGGFVEFAEVHGTLYGTPKSSVDAVAATGAVCVLDIDVQGAEQVKRSGIEALYIFVAPPSFVGLEQRLRGRGTETEDKIVARLAGAKRELAFQEEHPDFFDHVIVNGNLEDAYTELRSLVADARPLALSLALARRGLSELATTTDGSSMALVTLDVTRAALSDFAALATLPQLRQLIAPHNRIASVAQLAVLTQVRDTPLSPPTSHPTPTYPFRVQGHDSLLPFASNYSPTQSSSFVYRYAMQYHPMPLASPPTMHPIPSPSFRAQGHDSLLPFAYNYPPTQLFSCQVRDSLPPHAYSLTHPTPSPPFCVQVLDSLLPFASNDTPRPLSSHFSTAASMYLTPTGRLPPYNCSPAPSPSRSALPPRRLLQPACGSRCAVRPAAEASRARRVS